MAESFASTTFSSTTTVAQSAPRPTISNAPHVALDLPPHEREAFLKGVQLVHELIFDVPLKANRCLDDLLGLLRHVLCLVWRP